MPVNPRAELRRRLIVVAAFIAGVGIALVVVMALLWFAAIAVVGSAFGLGS